MAHLQQKQSFIKSVCLALLLAICALEAPTTNAQASNPVHVVRSGETLFSIARRYNTTVGELVALNELSNPNRIFVNQQLLLPDSTGEQPTAVPNQATHTVARGDNLMRLAIRYNTSVTEFADLNELPDWNRIYVGQVLRIPAAGQIVASPVPSEQPVVATPIVTLTTIPPTLAPTSAPPQVTSIPNTPTQQPTTVPTNTPQPVTGTGNLLTNGSFEDGWYNLNSIPELQVPSGWQLSWLEGPTGFGTEVWDVWVRPETRVLPYYQLPKDEQPLFIYEGEYTFKVFKGSGAHHTTLSTDVYLQPGTYQFSANVFPDLVESYEGGQKNWASDPVSGDIRITTGSVDSGWILPTFGQRNSYSQTFSIAQAQTVRISIEVRGRFAIQNNGWFIDHLELQQRN